MSDRQLTKEEQHAQWRADHTPKACPCCGNTEVSEMHLHLTTWFAHSLEEQDMHNTAELVEHQCHACSRSFWM